MKLTKENLMDWIDKSPSDIDLDIINDIVNKDNEIERLKKENNDLRLLYQRTYKHLFEKGNDELARYFKAQIDECPTFYVEPIIDYYQETKRLNNIINTLEDLIVIKLQRDYHEPNYRINTGDLEEIYDKLQELKGEDK